MLKRATTWTLLDKTNEEVCPQRRIIHMEGAFHLTPVHLFCEHERLQCSIVLGLALLDG